MHRYKGRNLRTGRISLEHQIYHITTVTLARQPVFEDFTMARNLIHCLEYASIQHWASTLAFVVMPDHLHWLLQLRGKKSLSQLVAAIKQHSGRFKREAIWQKGFHDRGVRKDEDLHAIARYIIANPVRAGLVQRAGDYPHWDVIWL